LSASATSVKALATAEGRPGADGDYADDLVGRVRGSPRERERRDPRRDDQGHGRRRPLGPVDQHRRHFLRHHLDPEVLCADAARYHGIYGVYGISVFAVRGVTVDELAQQVPLVRFDHLSLLTVKDVLAAGMRLEPTGRNPRHYTVGFDDLEDGVRRLAGCPHQVMPNSYHDA
jgi:hypothetical protein